MLLTPEANAEVPGLSIGPTDLCEFVGPIGGPFSPTQCDFTLTNSTASPITVNTIVNVQAGPDWLEATINNSIELSTFDEIELTVPANSSLPFTVRLAASAIDVTDPDNVGVNGSLEFIDPNDFGQQLVASATFIFTEGNDSFAGAQPLTPSQGSVSGSTQGTSKEPGEPNHAGNLGGASIWFRYDAPSGASGNIQLTTQASNIDTLLAVYTGDSVDSLTLLVENDDASTATTHSEVSFSVESGETYYIALDGAARNGNPGESGIYNLAISAVLAQTNDDFENAIPLTGLAGNITAFSSAFVVSTLENGEPPHGGGFGGSVWYRLIVPATGVYRITAGTPELGGFPTTAIYLGSQVNDLVEVASNSITSNTNELIVQLLAGAQYQIAFADNGQGDNYSISWTLIDPQPATGLFSSILPASRAVQLGQFATVFANIFNSSDQTGVNCRPEPPNQMLQFTPTGFSYQTTDAANSLSGSPNTPVNIPPGAVQNWLLQINSPILITGGKVGVRFVCDNLIAAPVFSDVNAWILRVLPSEPADVIAIGVSGGEPGVVDVPLNGAAAFAAAGVNIGTDSVVLVTPETNFESGLTLSLCETDLSGNCLNTPSPSLSIPNFARDQLRTFSVFISAGSETVEFDPGFKRIFLNFSQTGTTVGATSLAVRTSD